MLSAINLAIVPLYAIDQRYQPKDQIADLEDWFDFSVADNCMGTAECELVSPFVDSGKPVFNIEYTSTKDEIHICDASAHYGFNTIIKSYGVDASWQKCN